MNENFNLDEILEQKKKPTYKLSPSLVNSYLYYKQNPTQKNLQSVINYLEGKFESNKYFERGLAYEDEVFEGKHGKMSTLVKDLPRDTWKNLLIEMEDFNIYLSGKRDAVDDSRKIIYDIKRVNKAGPDSYNDDITVQHLYYFMLDEDKEMFYYLLAVSPTMTNNPQDITFKVIPKTRPNKEELKKLVDNSINEFIEFLKEKNLWQLYTSTQKTKWN